MKKLLLGLSVLSFLILPGCGSDSQGRRNGRNGQKSDPGTSVETMTVKKQDISEQVRAYGTVKSQDVVQVTPQISNRITKIYADLGDTVRQGQPLAKIYGATFQDQVQQAKAQVAQSQAAFTRDSAQFNRQKKLAQRNLISKSELDQAKATFQNSKSELVSAKSNLTQNNENLKNTIIRSPVYGVILTRNIAQGDLASSGQVAYEIGNLTGFETRVYLPLEDWRKVNVGQKVQFQLSSGRQSKATGRVARTSPRLDPTTGLGEVVIAFTNTGSNIYQGVLVKSIINVATHKNAVVLPRSALIENVQTLIQPESNTIETNRTYSAFQVQNDTIALHRKLDLGIEQGDEVEVLNGLQAGEQVVITGQESLEDSSKVHIAKENPFEDGSNVSIGEKRPNAKSMSDSSTTNSN